MPFDQYLLADRNEGLGANTNKGIRAARGEFILQLQDDFRFIGDPDFLQKCVIKFQDDPSLGIIRFTDVTTPTCFQYSDQPHLKRRELHDIVGYYKERVAMTVMERDFVKRWNRQSTYMLDSFGADIFVHTGGAHSFNPCNARHEHLLRLQQNPWLCSLTKAYMWGRHKIKRMLEKLHLH